MCQVFSRVKVYSCCGNIECKLGSKRGCGDFFGIHICFMILPGIRVCFFPDVHMFGLWVKGTKRMPGQNIYLIIEVMA